MTILEAKKIMAPHFIGPEELHAVRANLHITSPQVSEAIFPAIPWSEEKLRKVRLSHLLIFGVPTAADGEKLTLLKMRSYLGIEPTDSEPCFYNQDWYQNEAFARDTTLDLRWYLIRKSVVEKSRGKDPGELAKRLESGESLPSAVLTAFAFFAYFFATGGEKLWEHDFVWCSDLDGNGNRVYTGRYVDPKGINKNGFNIHRHLSIRSCYGVAPMQI